MTIQIDGINTSNKGAELMLVAILEEIAHQHPKATVLLNPNQKLDLSLLPVTQNTIKIRKGIKYSRIPIGILRRLNLPVLYFTHFYPKKGIDIVLDASGLQYSDKFKYSPKNILIREKYYKKLKQYNTNIIFLPQAYGPFDTEHGKNAINAIKENVDLIIARDKISYDNLIKVGFHEQKLSLYPDFTLKVKGVVLDQLNHLKNYVCIIPNKKMISHAGIKAEDYIDFLSRAIQLFYANNKEVFLLNHEGAGDLELCKLIRTKMEKEIEIVNGLSAKEVKGVIGQSFMTISSRFHGVASSLSSGVPCLSTSWNHKYRMLYLDFGIENQVMDIRENWEINREKIQDQLDKREAIETELLAAKKNLVSKNIEMWDKVWKSIN